MANARRVRGDAKPPASEVSIRFFVYEERLERSGGLRFVWLLAGAHEILDSFRGFSSLLLLELAYPARYRADHVGRRFALAVPRPSAGFLLHYTLFTLNYFYDFLF